MRHPSEGVLRRLVDEPGGVSVPDRDHVATCASCLARLAGVRADAAAVGAALGPGAAVDVDSAWQRLVSSTDRAPVVPLAEARRRRTRDLLRRPATAAVAVAVVLAGTSTAAANDWLQVFRTERVVALSLTTSDLLQLPDLSAYGELSVPSPPSVVRKPDAAAAAADSGLVLPVVGELPRGVGGEPVYQVAYRVEATFTFRAALARQVAAAAGEELPAPPAGLDGARLRLTAGPGVAQLWRSDSGAPALLVARAVAPTAQSSGVPLSTASDYLLSLPGLPDGVAEQLRAFTTDGGTLPLPVPAERARTSTADVAGSQATVVEGRDGLLSAVVWVRDGLLTVVAGSVDVDEALAVARELR
jgi:hypothetical protein